MNINYQSKNLNHSNADCLIFYAFKEDCKNRKIDNSELEKIDKLVNGKISSYVKKGAFSGKEGKHLTITGPEIDVILLGAGKLSEWDNNKLSTILENGTSNVAELKYSHPIIAANPKHDQIDVVKHAAISVFKGLYEYDKLKSKADDHSEGKKFEAVTIFTKDNIENHAAQISKGSKIGHGLILARNLVNGPPNYITPQGFVDEAKPLFEKAGLKVEVLEKSQVEAKKMGLFLSVNQGSHNPLKFMIIRHNPKSKKSDKRIALVGKGVTFDSGGINIKQDKDSMPAMKGDMGGAASVAGAMLAIAELDLPVEVNCYIPLTENMPSGSSTTPSNVYRAMNGKTVEIGNTDAEGRLVLADSLCYAVEEGATHLVDVATLTGAALVSVGELYNAFLTNNSELTEYIKKAANKSGELVWQLPLDLRYKKNIESTVADMNNMGRKPYGGTIIAGIFLHEFISDKPWLHLDIAPTFMKDADYRRNIATGSMVSCLTEFVELFV